MCWLTSFVFLRRTPKPLFFFLLINSLFVNHAFSSDDLKIRNVTQVESPSVPITNRPRPKPKNVIPAIQQQTTNQPETCQNSIARNPPICVVGSAIKPELVCQMRGNIALQNRSFLDAFLNQTQNTNNACSANPRNNNMDDLEAIATTIQRKPRIKRRCIEFSMKRITNLNNPRRLTCRSNQQVPTSHTFLSSSSNPHVKQELCITDDIIDYVHFAFEEVFACINAITSEHGNRPLDAAQLFTKINNESAFGFFLQSKAGIGLSQLTSIATKELSGNHSGNIYQQSALQNCTDPKNASCHPSCQKLRETLSQDLQFTDKGDVRHCQLVSLGEGIARNLFYGMSLLAHHRDSAPQNNIASVLRSYGTTNPDVIDMASLVSFGRNGLNGVHTSLQQIGDRIRRTNQVWSQITPSAMHKHLYDTSPYFKETANRMCEFLNNLPENENNQKDCKKYSSYSLEQLKGKECLE